MTPQAQQTVAISGATPVRLAVIVSVGGLISTIGLAAAGWMLATLTGIDQRLTAAKTASEIQSVQLEAFQKVVAVRMDQQGSDLADIRQRIGSIEERLRQAEIGLSNGNEK